MTRQRQDKLIWVLGRHAQLIKNKEILTDEDKAILTYIRWVKTLIVNQRALNEEYSLLKRHYTDLFGEDEYE